MREVNPKKSPEAAITRVSVAKNGEAVKTQWPQGFWGESTAIMRVGVAENGEAVKTQWPQGFWGESTAIMRISVAENGEVTGQEREQ